MEGRFRLRCRFVKTGRLRYLSHLEVLRAFERSIRRSGLPYCISEGFSPKMKVSFGPALGCGVAGLDEYFDLFLSPYVPPEEAERALEASCAFDLRVVECWYVPVGEASLDSQLVAARYSADVFSSPEGALDIEGIDAACAKLHDAGVIRLDRGRRKKPRDIALSRHVVEPVHAIGSSSGSVTQCLSVGFTTLSTEEGSLRPDVYLRELCALIDDSTFSNITRIQQLCAKEASLYPLYRPSAS